VNIKLEKAAEIILRGGLVVYPTDTFYALGANALNKKAVEEIFRVKKRPLSKPIPIIIADKSWLKDIVIEVPEVAIHLIKKYWPGPLTIVFRASNKLPSNLTGGTGKIGIRVCSHPLAQRLVSLVKVPITATSANISGEPPPNSIESVSLNGIDIIDGGPVLGRVPSTIIDVTSTPPVILRQGAIKITYLKI